LRLRDIDRLRDRERGKVGRGFEIYYVQFGLVSYHPTGFPTSRTFEQAQKYTKQSLLLTSRDVKWKVLRSTSNIVDTQFISGGRDLYLLGRFRSCIPFIRGRKKKHNFQNQDSWN
jgi:hypothetical protein